MPRPVSASFLLIVLMTGCAARGSFPLGPQVVAHEADATTRVVEAPRQTTYALYQPTAPGEVNSTPDGKVRLQLPVARGEPIGFEKARSGDLLAVAGAKRIPLSEGEYAWRYSESPAVFPSMFTGKVGKKLESAWQPASDVLHVSLSVASVVLYLIPFFR